MGGKPLKTYMMLRGGDNERRDGGRIDNRFTDRTGREHYDNGRFAPMRSEYDGGPQMGYRTNYPTHNGYESPSMGYYEPIRMDGYTRDTEPRRSWEIIENNSPHMEPRYDSEYSRDGMRRVMGFGGSSYVDHKPMDEMSHRTGEKMPGHASSKALPKMTREMAEEWMATLKNADGSRGPHWTFEEVKSLMQSRGVQGDPLTIWVGMNAEYSDGVMLNRKYGMDRPEYYLDAAVTKWMNDKDAVEDKAAAYYMHVVKH